MNFLCKHSHDPYFHSHFWFSPKISHSRNSLSNFPVKNIRTTSETLIRNTQPLNSAWTYMSTNYMTQAGREHVNKFIPLHDSHRHTTHCIAEADWVFKHLTNHIFVDSVRHNKKLDVLFVVIRLCWDFTPLTLFYFWNLNPVYLHFTQCWGS